MASDLDGIPDVDLSGVIKDLQQSSQKEEPVVEKKVEETQSQPEEFDLGQFKNPKDLLKSYKEIQAAFTRVTQENKLTKSQIAELKEQVELAKAAAYRQPQQETKRFDEAFVENPEAAIQQRVMQTVVTSRIAEVLEEEADKNREEFNERYAFAQQVAQQYPQLAVTPAGVKKLFQFGDKLRKDALKKNASKALESIFGEPLAEEEIAKLRNMVKGDKTIKNKNNISDAYMPDTSTSTRSGATADQTTNSEVDINEAIKKGDIDGVLKAKFASLMAE